MTLFPEGDDKMEKIITYEPYHWAPGLVLLGIFIFAGFGTATVIGKRKGWYGLSTLIGFIVLVFGLLGHNVNSFQKPVEQFLVDKDVIPQINFGRYKVVGQEGDSFLLERIEHEKTLNTDDRRR